MSAKKTNRSQKTPANKKASGGRSAPPCSPSSTPETDAHWAAIDGSAFATGHPGRKLMEKLERQRNIAVNALKELAAQYGHKSAHGCGCDDCRHIRPIEYAIRDATSPENVDVEASPPEKTL